MEAGIASVVAVQPDDTQVEVGLIGREGMSGIAVVLGGDQSPHSTYVEMAGKGQRISTEELRKAMKASASLHTLLLKFAQVFMVQTAHTAIANARAHIDRRCVFKLLMAHDRTRDDTLPLTHEFLALMLGRETGRGNRGTAKPKATQVDRNRTKSDPCAQPQGH